MSITAGSPSSGMYITSWPLPLPTFARHAQQLVQHKCLALVLVLLLLHIILLRILLVVVLLLVLVILVVVLVLQLLYNPIFCPPPLA